jgi:putative transcriptional regulator
MLDENEISKEKLAKKIGGEIVLSPLPGNTIQKWRNFFKVSQRQLSNEMKIMPSVISDYESGRRKSPGVKMIKKIVESLLKIDEGMGGLVIHEFNSLYSSDILNDAILDIKEMTKPINLEDFSLLVKGDIILGKEKMSKLVYGYTIIDSLKAILELSPAELVRLYGLTTERAMIFTGVKHGRSPLVAIKVTNLKPGVVVFHGLEELDKLAYRIAKVEGIPLIVSNIDSIEEMIHELRDKS